MNCFNELYLWCIMIRYCKKHFAFLVGYPRMGIFVKVLTLKVL